MKFTQRSDPKAHLWFICGVVLALGVVYLITVVLLSLDAV